MFGSIGKGMNIFINSINTLVGYSIFEELRNDHIAFSTDENPNQFFATLSDKSHDGAP